MKDQNNFVSSIGGGKDTELASSSLNSKINSHSPSESYLLKEMATIEKEICSLSTEEIHGAQLYSKVSSLISKLSTAISEAETWGFERDEIKKAISESRKVFSESPYVNRMQTWPRGYQGDFETVEMIHNGVGDIELSTVGDCIEYYAQTLPISQQHRNKLSFQQSLAMKCLRKNQNIMSIGCGGAIDICNAVEFFPAYSGTITFIDMDEGAIALVKERTAGFDCVYITKNIVRGLGGEQIRNYHLVLCGGLFDYLDDKVASLVLRQIKQRLTPDGKLFFTNIARGNPFRIQMEYLGDWILIERTEEDLEKMIIKSFGATPEIAFQRDFTGLAILATVQF